FALDHLIEIGVSRFVINTHKLPESFQNFFGKNAYRGCSTTLVHEPDLLETGGGIKNAERYFGVEPFITYSGDILTDIALQPLIDEHFHRGNDVTLALRETGLASGVAFRDHRVVDISNRYGVPGNYDFANIAVWNREIFRQIPPHRKISFVPIIGDWIGQGGKIGGVVKNDEDGPSSSTNADAFPASGCRSDKNQANRKRRIGPKILSNSLLAESDTNSRQVQSGAGRKSALRPDRKISRRTRNSSAKDLL